MRYTQGGGLTDEQRQFREGLRRMAAERLAWGETSSVVARSAGQRPVGAATAAGMGRSWRACWRRWWAWAARWARRG
ncbi:hypothetical protein [Streptomyces sp. AcE210]|uniref:hypothetical protein n=1 Tax=Streptomyces sp. AcE210 TaxID=2292703 RepID=UPI001F0C2F34|nr:hypothetical protein [Streptomyces sp. AcE210]